MAINADQDDSPRAFSSGAAKRRNFHVKRRRRYKVVALAFGAVLAFGLSTTTWLGYKASVLRNELEAAVSLLPQLEADLAASEQPEAAKTIDAMKAHTSAAREAAVDPFWRLAGYVPWFGVNFRAASEVATSADDVVQLAGVPLVGVLQSLDWQSLKPDANGVDLEPLLAANPKLTSAAHAVNQSLDRLDTLNADDLLPQVGNQLDEARSKLRALDSSLSAAADSARLIPGLMGAETPRKYLLLIQNNSEVRASGGIPGALAELTVARGALSLGKQSSAVELGVMTPTLAVDPVEQQIYSGRIGKFMQDVNMTPNFPTAASLAQSMWEAKTGQRVSGVISIDPVALSYLLEATGPVKITNQNDADAWSQSGLPQELNSDNVVPTLLSGVYSNIEQPQHQDMYFAGVAQEVFSALSSGQADAKKLFAGLARGASEGRVLVWSQDPDEQSVLANYPLSGSISGPSVSPAQFGVYFNDGTGAKMDYYVKRTVQLLKECPKDGYEQTTVRVTSTNTAPRDAATALPTYVTGNGTFGVPAGSVQTNIVAYGPAQANVETTKLNGDKTDFAPYRHSDRPVGIFTVRLAPGESKTVDFTFGKIVQHTEPNVVVTPTVQDVKDVTLPTETVACA